MKGMLVSVYRNGDDCTNSGVTSQYDRFVLVGEQIPKIFEATEEVPALFVKEKMGRVFAVPANNKKGVGPMFGGNFVFTSDSRFRKMCPYPIPVHDRYETVGDYSSHHS